MSRKSFDKDTLKEIGTRIRKIRGDLNQSEFAVLIGVGRPSVANYETGRRLPNRAILEKIAKIGDTTPDELLAPISSVEKLTTNFIEFNEKFQYRIINYLASCDESKVLPGDAVSEDEFAILKILRVLNQNDLIDVFDNIIKVYCSDSSISKTQYLNNCLKQLNSLKKKGHFAHGKDLRNLLIDLDNENDRLHRKRIEE